MWWIHPYFDQSNEETLLDLVWKNLSDRPTFGGVADSLVYCGNITTITVTTVFKLMVFVDRPLKKPATVNIESLLTKIVTNSSKIRSHAVAGGRRHVEWRKARIDQWELALQADRGLPPECTA
jgi:hypothetical protein